MSVTLLSRVFWSEFEDLKYKQGNKVVSVGKPVAKLVMLAIADNADDFGENSWQSFETISKKASVERRSAIRAVKALMEAGYLSVAGTSRYGTNDYKIEAGKLGRAPEARDRIGRPKNGDSTVTSFQETSDSEAKTSDSEAKTGDTGSPESSFKHPITVSRETQKMLLQTIEGAMNAGIPYSPDEETAALETLRKKWDSLMKTNSRWESWGTFDKWLRSEELQGRSVETFCKWFTADKFRRDSVGMWTPNGDKQGRWSFKAVYPQAFPQETIQQEPKPWTGVDTDFARAIEQGDFSPKPPMPEGIRVELQKRLSKPLQVDFGTVNT